MNIDTLSIKNFPLSFQEVYSSFKESSETLHITGCAGSADACIVADLFFKHPAPFLVLVADQKRADQLARECTWLIGEDSIAVFPSRDAIPYNMKSPFGPTIEKRFAVLAQLLDGKKKIYITPVVSLLQKIPAQKKLFNSIIRLRTNDEISLENLSTWLSGNGFLRQTIVEDIGTFAIRGGIVDIYPFLTENPIRLEFFGNTIETIKEFDVFKQTSVRQCSSVDIFPMKEFCFTDKEIDDALVRIEDFCMRNDLELTHFQKLKQQWKSHADHDGIEWFLHWFPMNHAHLAEYFPAETVIVWDDMFPTLRRMEENIYNYESHISRVPESLLPFVSKPRQLLIPEKNSIEDCATFRHISIHAAPFLSPYTVIDLGLKEQPVFNSNLRVLAEDLNMRDASGYSVTIVCENKGHAERLREIMETERALVTIALGSMERGFIDPDRKVALYSESQIFNRIVHASPVKKSRDGKGIPIPGFDSLLPGDYVVHTDHGISRFIGIERVHTAGINQDCMVLEFLEKAKVYVPVENFNKVQKYIGRDSSPPVLSRLGTNRWEQQKAKAREALKEMAQKLIQLYAKRQYLEGIRFPGESIWQKEFEDSFMYEETPDQTAAVNDVKNDMESARPMDRLVCGDVGFGKTEVAMRAAFKAATGGYQVALLAPTTILAAQHYATFIDRMGNFPLVIASLSRFQKTKEQKDSIRRLKNGEIDIVIGTHRILSKDVVFKNLGLIIIDEEQRFGVRHKEKLKEYRYKADVLSMTATPIPRTLHMSLVGIRDLSLINTPPRNRLPIETYVMEYHEEIVKNAIEAELDRGGQVYVVHNRIQSLNQLQMTVETLVPRARTALAHGQMDEEQLAQVMQEFVAGRYDVLIATTIIENGLDIPNVNTIIVIRSDMLGLSQLYQLRGRVGRSSEQAYAYFLTPPFSHISEIALKRIKALEQYTELGSGFQIAMRDLEIRGAGNILGADQHGFITAIGFELYCQLLREEVDKLSSTAPMEPEKEIKIDIPADAFIPAEYVPDSAIRISFYQECSSCKEFARIEELEKNMLDRFGPLPLPVQTLIAIVHIRIYGRKINLSHVALTNEKNLMLSFYDTGSELKEKLQKILRKDSRSFEISSGTSVVMKTMISSSAKLDKLQEISTILKHMLLSLQ